MIEPGARPVEVDDDREDHRDQEREQDRRAVPVRAHQAMAVGDESHRPERNPEQQADHRPRDVIVERGATLLADVDDVADRLQHEHDLRRALCIRRRRRRCRPQARGDAGTSGAGSIQKRLVVAGAQQFDSRRRVGAHERREFASAGLGQQLRAQVSRVDRVDLFEDQRLARVEARRRHRETEAEQ